MKVAFAGAFAAQMAEPVRARLSLPCEVVVDDEAGIVPRLDDVDVLVSMGFSAVMADAAPRLRLVQVPGAGLDRIDRGALGRARISPTPTVTRPASPSTSSAP